ncbi:MAG: S49 family peptidase [Hyphomicrobiaceae bacterium]
MKLFKRRPTVPVVRLSGPIGMATPLRPGVSIASVAGALERAFKAARSNAVAIVINSPGGSPVQSHLVYRRIRDLASERKRRVYVFAEDVVASGGYMIALAGDEIYADASSIVGSIGVISAGFGFNRLIDKIGVERRVHTSGEHKMSLDPFRPEEADDVARLKQIQVDVHENFKAMVRERRGSRLSGDDSTLFEGQIWSGQQAVELGLVDGLGDVRSKMRELFGETVRLKQIAVDRSWFKRRLIGVSDMVEMRPSSDRGMYFGLADDVVSTIEARALWSRFGL